MIGGFSVVYIPAEEVVVHPVLLQPFLFPAVIVDKVTVLKQGDGSHVL